MASSHFMPKGDSVVNKEIFKEQIQRIARFRLFYLLFEGGSRIFLPYFSIMLKQRGFTPAMFGTMHMLTSLSNFISRPILTYIADRFHLRKHVLVIGLLAWTICYLCITALPPDVQDICLNASSSSPRHADPLTDIDYSDVDINLNYHSDQTSKLRLNFNPARLSRKRLSSLDWLYDPSELATLFKVYAVILVVSGVFSCTTRTIFNGEVIASLGKEKNTYGWYKAFGGLGCTIGYVLIHVKGETPPLTRIEDILCAVSKLSTLF